MMIPATAPPLMLEVDFVTTLVEEAEADARMSIVEEEDEVVEMEEDEREVDERVLLLDWTVLVEIRDEVDVVVGLRVDDVVGVEDVDVVEVVKGTATK